MTNKTDNTPAPAEKMVRFHETRLNEIIVRLILAHERFKQANPDKVADAYTQRWLILNELEELLRDGVIELSPDEMRDGLLPTT